MRFDSFVGPSYTLDSLNAECQRCVNLYVERDETGQGRNPQGRLVGTPGLSLMADYNMLGIADTPISCLWSGGGRMFVGTGDSYFEVAENGALVLGSLQAMAAPVQQILANGRQLLILAGNLIYCDNGAGPVQVTLPAFAGNISITGTMLTWTGGDEYDIGMLGQVITVTIAGNPYARTVAGLVNSKLLVLNSTIPVADGSVGTYAATPIMNASCIAYMDGYFIAARPSSNQFNISALGDGSSWDPLDFDMKAGAPDHIVGMLADHQELWLFGSETSEVWRDTGAADFPFQRDPSAVLHFGSAAVFGSVSIGGQVGLLSADSRGGPVAYLLEGSSPRRVSTHAVEQAWRKLSPVAALTKSFAYTEDGHWFWVINFSLHATWVYDLTTGVWHERSYKDSVSGIKYGAKYHVHTYVPEWGSHGVHIVGDNQHGKLYYLSLDTYDDDGEPIERIRTSPHLTDEQKHTFYHKLRLDMETGVSPAAPAAVQLISLEISRDRGHTWDTPRTASTGAHDAYSYVVEWRRLGAPRDFVARVTIEGKTKVAINNAYLELTQGVS